MSGLRPIGAITAAIVEDLKFRRDVQHLHDLGPRAVAELLAGIGERYSIRLDIERRLKQYGQLTAAMLEVTGGDQFPPTPLHIVSGDAA